MNCKQYRAEIEESGFAAGRGAPRPAAHADGCAECRAYGDEAAKLRGLVAGLARVDAPPDFEFRLRARLSEAEAAGPRSWSQNLWPQNLWPRAAWLAAAGCLALAAALALQTRNPQPAEAQMTPARPPAAQTAANSDDANTGDANARAAARGVSGGMVGEVPPPAGLTASQVESKQVESDEALGARRGVRDASVAASAAKLSQRRPASAAAAEQPDDKIVAAGGAVLAPTETRTMSMTGSPVIVTSAIPLPVSADERPLQVLFKDTQGGSRVVNVDPVAYGSDEPAARPTNVTFTKAAKKQGVW